MKVQAVSPPQLATSLSLIGAIAAMSTVNAGPVTIDFSSGGLDPNDASAPQYRAYLEDDFNVKGTKSQSWSQPKLTSGEFHFKNGIGSYNRIVVTEMGGDGSFDALSVDVIADPLGLLFYGQKTDLTWVHVSVPANAAASGSPIQVLLGLEDLTKLKIQTLSRPISAKHWITSIDNLRLDHNEPLSSITVPDGGVTVGLLGLGLLTIAALEMSLFPR